MGRIFEKRKHKMFARYAKMAKAFTRIGREIVIAVKAGGPNPDSNSRLRAVIQNAKSINMPKDRIDNAIKRATEKDSANYEEVIYEGYAPEQPIYFSHKIHAGQNAISCVYCHSGVEKSKISNVPSANVCMNCHKAIQEGTVTGKKEIAKIYIPHLASKNPDILAKSLVM
jgi:hypothetical protein